MKTLHAFTQFVVLVSLPLLLGGCGENETVGKVQPAEGAPVKPNLKYEIKDGTVTITGCDKKASGELTIPMTIEGKTVTRIGDSAFARCRSLTSITIPDSVTTIENSAFAGCTSLTSITIPDSVTSIGSKAFSGCESLTTITIPDSVTSIGDWTLYACSSLTSITLPDGVTSIGTSAFSICTSLTAVTFLGDAPNPKGGRDVFFLATPTIYRKPEAKGWGDTFAGRPVKLISEKP